MQEMGILNWRHNCGFANMDAPSPQKCGEKRKLGVMDELSSSSCSSSQHSPQKRKSEELSSSSSTSTHKQRKPAPKLGIVGAELARRDCHCGFCDTLIRRGSPRIIKVQYHAPGAYVRNNGEKTGVNSGGIMPLYLHPQCAWTAMTVTSKNGVTCSGCGENLNGE